MRILSIVPLVAAFAATAATPEIQRPVGTPQADGVTHLVRGIPEACAWLEGRFTGDAAAPYRFAAVRSSPNCQPRARFVDFARAKPATTSGWVLNDVIRVPSAACPGLQAVVEVWRRPAASKGLALDAQGRARIYLQDAKASAAKGVAVGMYAARLRVEGSGCAASK